MTKITKFQQSGFAEKNDLQLPEFQSIYQKLHGDQENFLKLEGSFRSKDYVWPRNALNNWSRVWEYPYVFGVIQKIVKESDAKLKIADYGSGANFFHFPSQS